MNFEDDFHEFEFVLSFYKNWGNLYFIITRKAILMTTSSVFITAGRISRTRLAFAGKDLEVPSSLLGLDCIC